MPPSIDPLSHKNHELDTYKLNRILAQVPLREGFGLTTTEATRKGVPALVSGTAAGLRAQVEDSEHGRVLLDPTDSAEVARTIAAMLADHGRDRWVCNARHGVIREALIFTELRGWLELLGGVVGGDTRS